MNKTTKKDEFATNKFVKKYKAEMTQKEKEYWQDFARDDAIESAIQAKSWSKYGVGMQVVSLWSLLISFILGFVVCAILVSLI